MSELDQQFCEVIALTEPGRFTGPYAWYGNGAPPHARVWLTHAFIAKSVYQFPTTAALPDAPALPTDFAAPARLGECERGAQRTDFQPCVCPSR